MLEILFIILLGTTFDFLKTFLKYGYLILKSNLFIKLINELDLDLKFVFEELTTNINFLDINLKIVDNHLHFDIYLSPFDTKNKILLLLVRHMIRIAIESRGFRLDEKKPSKESNKLFIYKAISIEK